MKTNIDLTESGDFKKEITKFVSFKQLRIPKFVAKEEATYYINTGGLVQGSKRERRSHLIVNGFCDAKTCDCCGREILPYHNNTLCERCDNMHTTDRRW